jgi:hypothetical protein
MVYSILTKEAAIMIWASKINKVRTLALLLTFLGIGVMYFGFVWPGWMVFFLFLGILVIFSSVGLYFWIGILSLQAVQVECPKCGRMTKILGKVDQCPYCKVYLSLDPAHAPKKSTHSANAVSGSETESSESTT